MAENLLRRSGRCEDRGEPGRRFSRVQIRQRPEGQPGEVTMISIPKVASNSVLAVLVWLGAAVSIVFSTFTETHEQRGAGHKQSDKFSDIVLYTQHGKAVRFYNDLVKDKTVIINLTYTGCGDTCPAS